MLPECRSDVCIGKLTKIGRRHQLLLLYRALGFQNFPSLDGVGDHTSFCINPSFNSPFATRDEGLDISSGGSGEKGEGGEGETGGRGIRFSSVFACHEEDGDGPRQSPSLHPAGMFSRAFGIGVFDEPTTTRTVTAADAGKGVEIGSVGVGGGIGVGVVVVGNGGGVGDGDEGFGEGDDAAEIQARYGCSSAGTGGIGRTREKPGSRDTTAIQRKDRKDETSDRHKGDGAGYTELTSGAGGSADCSGEKKNKTEKNKTKKNANGDSSKPRKNSRKKGSKKRQNGGTYGSEKKCSDKENGKILSAGSANYTKRRGAPEVPRDATSRKTANCRKKSDEAPELPRHPTYTKKKKQRRSTSFSRMEKMNSGSDASDGALATDGISVKNSSAPFSASPSSTEDKSRGTNANHPHNPTSNGGVAGLKIATKYGYASFHRVLTTSTARELASSLRLVKSTSGTCRSSASTTTTSDFTTMFPLPDQRHHSCRPLDFPHYSRNSDDGAHRSNSGKSKTSSSSGISRQPPTTTHRPTVGHKNVVTGRPSISEDGTVFAERSSCSDYYTPASGGGVLTSLTRRSSLTAAARLSSREGYISSQGNYNELVTTTGYIVDDTTVPPSRNLAAKRKGVECCEGREGVETEDSFGAEISDIATGEHQGLPDTIVTFSSAGALDFISGTPHSPRLHKVLRLMPPSEMGVIEDGKVRICEV